MKNTQQNVHIDERELRKRRRERIIMVVVGILAVTFTLIASQLFNKDDLSLTTNIFVYGLTSINVILIIFLLIDFSFNRPCRTV
jgi:two-component system nitrogen regulation sensor histidine kinase NtrY